MAYIEKIKLKSGKIAYRGRSRIEGDRSASFPNRLIYAWSAFE